MVEEQILPVLARNQLLRELRTHPDAAKHVAVERIDKLPKHDLLMLAAKLEIDVKAIVDYWMKHGQGLESVWEQDDIHLHNYTDKHPAFKGEYEFDLVFELLGHRILRKAKIHYDHTPEWPYWDLNKKAEFEGWPSQQLALEIRAEPEESKDDGTFVFAAPEWHRVGDIVIDGMFPHATWDAIYDAIDEQCKAEDMKRRRAVKKKPRR